MSPGSPPPPRAREGIAHKAGDVKLQDALLRLAKGGPEQQAIEAGEIDAVIDHAGSNVILLPAARRALRETGNEASIANRLLAALPRAEYLRLLPGLEPLTLRPGEIIHEAGAPIRHVYFPVDCVVCLLAPADARQALEVGLVGREGMVGISLALGVDVSSVRALVQESGTAMRMKAALFTQELRQCPQLQRDLFRRADAELALAGQIAACNQFHAIEPRLARWLLMASDRVVSKELSLTQAFLGEMLGVRRATISDAIGPLQSRNLVRYVRGKLRILDRKGLEAAACSCYMRLAR
jgi:CRP-like cAMP-binding protein